jgi:hypothetical protein
MSSLTRSLNGLSFSKASSGGTSPSRASPGVTYRSFAVRWRVAARLEDPELS